MSNIPAQLSSELTAWLAEKSRAGVPLEHISIALVETGLTSALMGIV